MQENEFEKQVRLKMDELQLVPGEDVWKNVSANIHKEKRRKRFLFFLVAFTFLGGSTAFYFYNNSNNTVPALAGGNHILPSVDPPNKSSNKSLTDVAVPRADSPISDLPPKQITVANESHNKDIQANKEINSRITQVPAVRKNIAITRLRPSLTSAYKQVSNKTIKSSAAQLLQDVSSTKPVLQRANPVEQIFNQQGDVAQNPASEKIDSAKEKPLDKQIAEVKKDTAQPVIVKDKSAEKIKVQSNKKWKLGFTLFTGVSNNLSAIDLFRGGALSYSNSAPTPGTGTGNNGATGSTINKLNYKSSFSYGLGLYLKKRLNKTVSFSAGTNYHFLSATSLAGSRNTTTQTFYDASFQSSAIVSTYYSLGQTVEYRNKYHLVELPLTVFIQLNKNQNKSISLTAGISPAYLISSKALYGNTNQNVYYENNDQFKKLLLAGQVGIQFSVFNASHFNFAAGPEVQYGFNNMAKPATATNQHLLSAGLRLNVTLK